MKNWIDYCIIPWQANNIFQLISICPARDVVIWLKPDIFFPIVTTYDTPSWIISEMQPYKYYQEWDLFFTITNNFSRSHYFQDYTSSWFAMIFRHRTKKAYSEYHIKLFFTVNILRFSNTVFIKWMWSTNNLGFFYLRGKVMIFIVSCLATSNSKIYTFHDGNG